MDVSPTRAALRRYDRSPFAFDLRAVGLFRVLLALTILFDQWIRVSDWQAFHSAVGLISSDDSRAWGSRWLWSLYWLSDGPLLPYVLEALRFAASISLLLGVRSRLSAIVLFVLLASVATRNPLPLQGGDKVLIVMTFFAAFLPLGQRFSLTRLWFGEQPTASYRSAATAAYAVQILLVWFMAGILKTGEPWWADGTAISMALHLEAFVSEFARLWRHWDWLLQPMTYFVFWLECLAPLLVLVPNFWARVVGLVALASLEVGIYLSLEVGLFPLISMVSLVPVVPPRAVDLLARWFSGRARTKGSELVLFYDRDCRFCAFACRFLLGCCGIHGAKLREAQSDSVAAGILEDSFAWSVTDRVSANSGKATPSDPEEPYCRGWSAVLLVVRRSPRPWLTRVLPGDRLGQRLYASIGRNRGVIGSAGRFVFGRSNARGWHGQAGRFMASSALAVVLAWNVVSYTPLRDLKDFRPWVDPMVSAYNLKQHWGMFAPHPPSRDFWHVMSGLSRDGRRADLLSGLPVSLEPPRDGPDYYGGYRWRKVIHRSIRRGELARVLRYFCATGRGAAFDLWEFSRPNLGVAATVDAPYKAVRLARWRCPDVDDELVEDFRADIDAMLASEPEPPSEKKSATGMDANDRPNPC